MACVCHFNGYEVKDAFSRREIENIKTNYPSNETATAMHETINQEIANVNQKVDNLQLRFDLINQETRAEFIKFDNTTNYFTSTNVQNAIEEVKSVADNARDLALNNSTAVATGVSYDNSVSGLTATSVQSAIDELAITIKKDVKINGTLLAGETTLTLTNENITADSVIDIYNNQYGVSASNVEVTEGQIVLTYEVLENDLNVIVKVGEL